jgi:biopolymer transport protein TolQ
LLIQGDFWELLAQSSLFAKIIILILVVMSVASWAIIFNRWRLYRRADSESRRFLASFRRKGRLADMKPKLMSYKRSPLARLFGEGYREYERLSQTDSLEPESSATVTKLAGDQIDSIGRVLERETMAQVGRLERNVSFLATTGNVAPFFGLLGTCWGIMYAFLNIGVQKSASLIVVAPGIAEALVATIFGLAVAIPAVIGYNWCNTRLKFMADDMDSFSLEFLATVTREQS